jgi:hypothetical protein
MAAYTHGFANHLKTVVSSILAGQLSSPAQLAGSISGALGAASVL